VLATVRKRFVSDIPDRRRNNSRGMLALGGVAADDPRDYGRLAAHRYGCLPDRLTRAPEREHPGNFIGCALIDHDHAVSAVVAVRTPPTLVTVVPCLAALICRRLPVTQRRATFVHSNCVSDSMVALILGRIQPPIRTRVRIEGGGMRR
jgi:hypothetical protein